jgi:head-tail adaptor
MRRNTKIRFIRNNGIQEPVYGTVVDDWQTVGETWANKKDKPPGDDEAVLDGAIETTSQKVTLKIRWRDDITSKDRVIILHPLARTMEIIGGPAEIGARKQYMQIECQEVST